MGISTLERETEAKPIPPPDDLHLLVQLEALRDENSRSRLREAAWISIILHLIVLFSIRELPKILPQREVTLLSPDQQLKERDLTYIEQPPDTQQVVTPPDTSKISDKNRIAQSKNPQVDRKTLEQLARAGREGAPGAQPTPPSPPPQIAMNQPAQPLPPQQQAPAPQPQSQAPPRLQSPPVVQRPSFRNAPPMSAGSAIEQAARSSAQARSGGTGGQFGGGPGRESTARAGYDVLSDTRGVDFAPYLQRVLYLVRTNWYAILPESVYPPLSRKGLTVVEFYIGKNGQLVGSPRISRFSGDVPMDRAAWGAITGSNPFPPLPAGFPDEYFGLRIYFYYNPDKDELR